jgi:hypothetical protein
MGTRVRSSISMPLILKVIRLNLGVASRVIGCIALLVPWHNCQICWPFDSYKKPWVAFPFGATHGS